MRYMGIDYGTKRVGVALSDEEGRMSFPHTTLENTKQLVEDVVAIVREYAVDEVVVGSSLDLNNEPNALEKHATRFVADLEAVAAIPVHREAEQFTTQAALRTQGRTKDTDASAAALILDSFLLKQQ